MRIEQVVIPALRAVVNRPRLAGALFRFDRWGNALGPDRYRYPYPIYDRMRPDGPIAYRRLYQQWFVAGHELAKEALASNQMIVSPQREVMLSVRPYTKLGRNAVSFLDNMLLLIDPPEHTRLRRLVSRAFTPRQISRIDDDVERLAKQLVADLVARSGPNRQPVDVFEHFTGPLPIQVICQLLGIPEERWGWAEEVSEKISAIGNTMAGFDPGPCSDAIDDLHRYILDLARQRRESPADDLITELALVDDDGEGLSDDELVAIVGLLMFAGHETTSGFIGSAIIALAEHPDQRRLIVDRPDLWENAIEELLRWDTPVQVDPRAAAEDLELGGKRIKKGSNVLVMLGAANRDPDYYDDPNTLRLDRHDPNPVSFGHGLHHCLGHALARLEARHALRAFIDGFGDYEVAGDVTWKRSIITRGPTRLLVRPGPSASGQDGAAG